MGEILRCTQDDIEILRCTQDDMGTLNPGLLLPGLRTASRLSPEPFSITREELSFFDGLGQDLLHFYGAAEALYRESRPELVPAWVRGYLRTRIDEAVLDLADHRASRDARVGVMRPDVLCTKEGMAITELDSVPGGMGWTGSLTQAYGGGEKVSENFWAMLRDANGGKLDHAAIVVSEESADYWEEMAWLAARVGEARHSLELLRPQQIAACREGLCGPQGKRIEVLYRFFELFDHRAIACWDLMADALKKGKVVVTPPIKSHLEEKSLFALFHHPCLDSFWSAHLPAPTRARLQGLFPRTWILDPRPLPPQAVVPLLRIDQKPVQRWEELFGLSQRQRRMVIKPSGYSPLAWGSRGVRVGHDLSQLRWGQEIRMALERFEDCPYVLQAYKDPRRVSVPVLGASGIEQMQGRVRLCPFYFVHGGKAHLAGILATICPLDKKVIHGMTSAVMSVAGLKRDPSLRSG